MKEIIEQEEQIKIEKMIYEIRGKQVISYMGAAINHAGIKTFSINQL